ncbi:response regulator transcription factor [Amycolatopsis sp. OK19-0408]|uniref:Response regulator transcription factor n=1 Tax=Amycolatopsis iheyensis TaxID=2945988 RepID=A0A9X2SR01_9PSEU|nr:response regulator transcription factor [Amycolatopsis iheyensis]MCR6489911.1 response regulator transcription factor [Amycolatopsis iheyensis]
MATDTCQVCGEALPASTETGRPRKFCSDKCRSRAHRVRRTEDERSRERLSRVCEVRIGGRACKLTATFALSVDGQEMRVCPACQKLAMAFLVDQGESAAAVEIRRLDVPETEPARVATGVSGTGKVLLIEDDDRVSQALRPCLERRGWHVTTAADGKTGLYQGMTAQPDVVLLDLGLPDIDGLTLLREIRKTSDVPVIVVTARGEIEDITRGLDVGADDYLVKPYAIEELLARMRKAVRQRTRPPEQGYDDGVLRVGFAPPEVHVGDAEVVLPRREFALLELLVRGAGTIQSADRIIAHVWGDPPGTAAARKRTLAVLVAVLRTKLRENGLGADAIVSARGLGYYYQPPNRPARPASGPRVGYSHAERFLNG